MDAAGSSSKHRAFSVGMWVLPLPCMGNVSSLACPVFPLGISQVEICQSKPVPASLDSSDGWQLFLLREPASHLVHQPHPHRSGVPAVSKHKDRFRRHHAALAKTDTGHQLVTSSGTRKGHPS